MLCDPKPLMSSYVKNEHICGRPLGLRFDKRTGELYIADSYFGLMKVGPEGGLATSLVTEAEGVPLSFTNDLDIDDEGNVYFTDSSTKYHRRYAFAAILFFCSSLPSAIIAYNWHLCLTTETYIEVSMQTLHLLIFSRKVCMIDLGVRICMFEPIEILTLYNFNRYL